MSSWFQYEALKYVSFPTQVLAKASKVIPVMLMGKVVQSQTYPMWEYGCAVMLSLGVALFMFSKADEEPASGKTEVETTFAGVILLVGYMAFDSFTSNYQSALFKGYKMSKFQMMFGVRIVSFSLFLAVQMYMSVCVCVCVREREREERERRERKKREILTYFMHR